MAAIVGEREIPDEFEAVVPELSYDVNGELFRTKSVRRREWGLLVQLETKSLD